MFVCSGESDKRSRGIGTECETSMVVEVTVVSHTCGRHHFMDTCGSKRDCVHAYVGRHLWVCVSTWGGECSRVCVCACACAR